MIKRLLSLAMIAWLLPLAALASPNTGDRLRTIGSGPLGNFVEAPDAQVFANVLGFLYGTPTIGYEQALGRDNSWTGQVGFRSQGASDFNVTYLGLLGSYRWWVGDHAKMQGVYVGPFGNVSMVNASYDYDYLSGATLARRRDSASSYILGVGAEGGYQWILSTKITLGIGLNLGYYFGSLSLNTGAPSIPFGGFGAGLNGTVGYAF